MALKFKEDDDGEPGVPTLELEPPEEIPDPTAVAVRPARPKEKTDGQRS
jgi:hypothetical protein